MAEQLWSSLFSTLLMYVELRGFITQGGKKKIIRDFYLGFVSDDLAPQPVFSGWDLRLDVALETPARKPRCLRHVPCLWGAHKLSGKSLRMRHGAPDVFYMDFSSESFNHEYIKQGQGQLHSLACGVSEQEWG